jgi:hypothetical protein
MTLRQSKSNKKNSLQCNWKVFNRYYIRNTDLNSDAFLMTVYFPSKNHNIGQVLKGDDILSIAIKSQIHNQSDSWDPGYRE